MDEQKAKNDPEQSAWVEGDKRCGPEGTWEIYRNGRWENAGIGHCAIGETSSLV